MPRRGAHRGEDAGEVDVDGTTPPFRRVALERPFVVARTGRSRPGADEPRAGVDSHVGEDDIEAAVGRGRLVDRGIEIGVIGDVDAAPAYIEPVTAQPLDLALDRLPVNVEDRDPPAVLSERLDVTEPDSARSAGDHCGRPADVEQLRCCHRSPRTRWTGTVADTRELLRTHRPITEPCSSAEGGRGLLRR